MNLISLNLATLTQLSLLSSGKAPAYARNVLINYDDLNYQELILCPDLTKSGELENEYQRLISSANNRTILEVFPNPAKEHIIVKWNLEKASDNILIRITDNNSYPIIAKNVTGTTNQQVINTSGLKSGIYYISIYTDNKLMDVNKVTILK